MLLRHLIVVFSLVLAAGCGGFYHHDPVPNYDDPPAPSPGGAVPGTSVAPPQESGREADAKLANVNQQLSSLDSQILSLNGQINQYQNSNSPTQALQAHTQGDQLQMQRTALAQRQGSLQIIRNSKPPPSIPKPAGPTAPWVPSPIPGPAPIH